MKSIILLGTLKKSGLSNTETLCEFLCGRMKLAGVQCEIIKLVDHEILPGTYSDMGEGDEWPGILEKVLGNQSSEIQRVIERLDELHDKVLAGEPSPLEGKVGGVIIIGDSDGAEHIIGNICNFFNAVGMLIPPYVTLSVLCERQAKDKNPRKNELLNKYESDYASTADKMIRQLLKYAYEPQ